MTDDANSHGVRPRCFATGCDKEFESVGDMTPVAGRGDRSPRFFCESCAERLRRGPPIGTE